MAPPAAEDKEKQNVDRTMRRLENKVHVYFRQAQGIYDSMKLSTPSTLETFLSKAMTIDTVRSEFKEALDEKNEYLDKIGSEADYSSLLAFDDMFASIKFRYTEVIASRNATNSKSSSQNDQPRKNGPKLPRLELLSFNGDIEAWPLFYETFRSAIHENCDLTDGERIQYLLGKLTGKAQAMCQGFMPSADNYPVLWNMLVTKYNDKRVLAASYMDTLLNLPAVSNSSPTALENFIDKFSSTINALKQLNFQSLEDMLFIHIGSKKIDVETLKYFEMSYGDKMPTFSQFVEFVRKQAHILQRSQSVSVTKQPKPSLPSTSGSSNNTRNNSSRAGTTKSFVSVADSGNHCVLCKGQVHSLSGCSKFVDMSPRERFDVAKKAKICVNCLENHNVRHCKSDVRCDKCGGSRSHHRLLCFANVKIAANKNNNVGTALPTFETSADTNAICGATDAQPQTVSLCAVDDTSAVAAAHQQTVLLGTAQCNVVDKMGNTVTLRALVDSGSQKDIITAECCNKLGLQLFPTESKHVSGLGDMTNPIEGTTCLTVRSRYDDETRFTIQPLVVQRITNELPTATIDAQRLDYLNDIPLADSNYAVPGEIDLLIGSDIFARIMRPNTVSRADTEPVAIETLLGYLIVGKAPVLGTDYNRPRSYCTFHVLENCMNRFLELEDVPNAASFSKDEQECENIYRETTKRDESGRYVVNLPFKNYSSELGDSMQASKRRFLSLERKLLANPAVKVEYDNVIKEYLDKEYLLPVGSVENINSEDDQYVIPTHGIVRLDKSTTKLRVVLDASMKTTSGVSLNDILYSGPNLQNELFDIILNFRLFAVAISADIRQMFLRILTDKKHTRFQRILYRFNPNDPLQVFELTRLPFGLCCSPYLAIRTVRKLASDERTRFPLAASVAERDMYCDDLATSCSQPSEGIELSNQLISMFLAGGFELVKFSSNSSEVMAGIPVSHRVTEAVEFSPESYFKILGLKWLPAEDMFTFSVNVQLRECTKRNILSTIARLWDLMGYVAPVTLLAKLIIKSLWIDNVDWDDTPPQAIVSLWRQFESELPALEAIRIPRHVGAAANCVVTVLGFADASEKAYGGVVYLHVYFPDEDRFVISLMCAKSRVAPLRNVTLARLELCGSMILAKLMRIVIDTYSKRCKINNVYAFSDSTVALAWIHSAPSRWHTFVANRIAKIQENLDPGNFYHIPGKENPADCLSRGLSPSQLMEHPLWFHGPRFARLPVEQWPVQSYDPSTACAAPEMKPVIMVNTDVSDTPLFYSLAIKMSSWFKLIKTVIYVLRFAKKLPRKFEIAHIETAELAVIKDLQMVHFDQEFKNAQSGKGFSLALQKLKAFIHNGILRVGGRLSNSSLNYDSQHPVLIPRRDHIVDLIIDHYHRKYLHTGPQLLMSLLRQKYWILSARNIVRQRVHKCNICFRHKPRNECPQMADLPACRVQESIKPFHHTGIDYAGPMYILPHRRRGVHSQKAYICLFVCLVTKAVHIELASDLSTESFLNAMKRFIARRGPIGTCYSDCGSNFIGSKSYLDEMYNLIHSEEYRDKFANELRDKRIEWKFNPPSAPHFGGIWEGNIRSVKMHLNKVVGNRLLTFEEMLTVLAQVECILNSRPLSVMSSDPSEPLALTPAHFLTLTPLKSLPSEALPEDINLNRRKRIVDNIVQSFWRRWKLEYLNTLQGRYKWTKNSNPISKDTVVLLKSDNSAPLDWPLGIIEDVFPGKDGVIRVVNVRTKSGTYRRPVVKIFPLPTQ